MVNYKCLRCGQTSLNKYDIKKHLERKKLCNSEIADISREDCLKVLMENNFEYGLELYKKEIEKLKHLNVNNSSGQVTLGDHNNINSNNTYNIEIKINSYKNTDYSILKNNIQKCIKNGKLDESKLLKLLHFSEEFPQNHNIKIENKRDKTIKFFNGEKFEDSEYSGKEGIWDFTQNVLTETEDQEFIEGESFDAINTVKLDNKNINKNEKSKKLNKLESILYNGKDLVNKTQKQFNLE